VPRAEFRQWLAAQRPAPATPAATTAEGAP
jgi:hypothetical protein